MDNDSLDRNRVSAVATRLINHGWFRVGSERYVKESQTFGITTLRKSHVNVRGQRIAFHFRTKHRAVVRTTLVDAELADAMNEPLALPGGPRLFRYECVESLCNFTGARLNEYVRDYLGDEFTAKDFSTWGGTLMANSAVTGGGLVSGRFGLSSRARHLLMEEEIRGTCDEVGLRQLRQGSR